MTISSLKTCGELREWVVKDGRLVGKVYGHYRYADGHETTTSRVRRAWVRDGVWVVHTQVNGYQLTPNEDYRRWFDVLCNATERKRSEGGKL